jgi:hypothetical protein
MPESEPFGKNRSRQLSAQRLTNFTHEASLLRRCDQGTAAGSALRRSFLSIWSEILRRVRRSDQANSRRSMQPTRVRRPNAEAVKGQFRALAASDDLDHVIAVARV